MSEAKSVQQEVQMVESREETESQLARHLEQQPASIQTIHKVMLVLEAIGVVLAVGLFILAVYVSITWKTHGELAVPRWWMASQLCAAFFMVIVGLHTLIVKAYLPMQSPGSKESIDTGRQAVKKGWGVIGLGILWAAAWGGMYLYIVLSGAKPLETFIPFVVILSIGVPVVGGIVSAIQRRAKSQ